MRFERPLRLEQGNRILRHYKGLHGDSSCLCRVYFTDEDERPLKEHPRQGVHLVELEEVRRRVNRQF